MANLISAREAIRPAVRGHRGPLYSTIPRCKYCNKYIKLKGCRERKGGGYHTNRKTNIQVTDPNAIESVDAHIKGGPVMNLTFVTSQAEAFLF